MSRVVQIGFFIMCFNIGLMLTNSIDDVYLVETNSTTGLFGAKVQPYVSYNGLNDAQGYAINFSDKNSMENTTQRAVNYGPQSGLADDVGFWTLTKQSVVTVVNFLYRGFFGLPAFLYEHLSMPYIFVPPLYIFIGFIEIMGIIEIVRGQST